LGLENDTGLLLWDPPNIDLAAAGLPKIPEPCWEDDVVFPNIRDTDEGLENGDALAACPGGGAFENGEEAFWPGGGTLENGDTVLPPIELEKGEALELTGVLPKEVNCGFVVLLPNGWDDAPGAGMLPKILLTAGLAKIELLDACGVAAVPLKVFKEEKRPLAGVLLVEKRLLVLLLPGATVVPKIAEAEETAF
jgi:hypothetical protein